MHAILFVDTIPPYTQTQTLTHAAHLKRGAHVAHKLHSRQTTTKTTASSTVVSRQALSSTHCGAAIRSSVLDNAIYNLRCHDAILKSLIMIIN